MTPGLRWRNIAALVLGVLALLHMAGRIFGIRPLVGVGAAWMFAPAPKVFSDVDGLETFASRFTMIVEMAAGETLRIPITPELYQRLRGPYNRRNVFGAALSYAPRLPTPLWEAVYCHGMRPGGPLRSEFGIPADAASIKVEIRTMTRGRADVWMLDPPC